MEAMKRQVEHYGNHSDMCLSLIFLPGKYEMTLAARRHWVRAAAGMRLHSRARQRGEYKERADVGTIRTLI